MSVKIGSTVLALLSALDQGQDEAFAATIGELNRAEMDALTLNMAHFCHRELALLGEVVGCTTGELLVGLGIRTARSEAGL